MPHTTAAVLLYRPGRISWHRQYLACLPYLMAKGYEIASIAQDEADAIALVRMGVAVVVVAVARDGDEDLRGIIEDAGGRLECCRSARLYGRRPPRSSTDDLVTRMFEAGLTTDQIVKITQKPRRRIRTILDRLRGQR